MTFCFAWRNKNDISIIADSLITLNKDSKSKKTSFDENIKDFRIEEKDSKLCVIRNTIVSYAGDVSGGLSDILSHYEKYSEDNISEVENLKSAVYADIREGENIEFLLAYVDKNKKSCLCKLKFEGSKIIHEELIDNFSYIGNQEYGGLDKNIEIYEFVRKMGMNIVNERIWFLTSLQHHGLFTSEIKNGVGGVFKTISIVNGRILWCDNISYNFGIFEESNFITKKIVEVYSFKNHIYIKSDFVDSDIKLTNCLNTKIIIPPIDFKGFDYYVFCNYLNRNICIVPNEFNDEYNRKIAFNQLRNGENNRNISEYEQIGLVIKKCNYLENF